MNEGVSEAFLLHQLPLFLGVIPYYTNFHFFSGQCYYLNFEILRGHSYSINFHILKRILTTCTLPYSQTHSYYMYFSIFSNSLLLQQLFLFSGSLLLFSVSE